MNIISLDLYLSQRLNMRSEKMNVDLEKENFHCFLIFPGKLSWYDVVIAEIFKCLRRAKNVHL